MKDTVANRAALREEIRAIRDRLASLTVELDHIDHDAARELHCARGALFNAHVILRAPPLEERPEWTGDDFNDKASRHHY